MPVVVFALGLFLGGPGAQSDRNSLPVWFWFATCGGPVMGLEVRFDGTVLYRTEFPICKADFSSSKRQGEESGKIRFLFKPERSITWEGYRDPAAVTAAGHVLNVDLWQAGADPEDLILGVSFGDEHDTYMNTVHMAFPGKRDVSNPAEGIEIVTFPVAARAKKAR